MTKKINNRIQMDFENIDLTISDLKNNFNDLSKVFDECFNEKLFKSEYKCSKCESVLYYDFIGEEEMRLFCFNCNEYSHIKINNF